MLKLASSPSAAANSFNVSKVDGALLTIFDTAVVTKAVEAALVELSPADCVVITTCPAIGALPLLLNLILALPLPSINSYLSTPVSLLNCKE